MAGRAEGARLAAWPLPPARQQGGSWISAALGPGHAGPGPTERPRGGPRPSDGFAVQLAGIVSPARRAFQPRDLKGESGWCAPPPPPPDSWEGTPLTRPWLLGLHTMLTFVR